MNPDPLTFLQPCEVIDFESPNVSELARSLDRGDGITTAKRCFEFVRDEIRHSSDFQLNPVTCTASEVLAHRTGYCYAKSHLLCALLRANGVPAGLCYQRLSIDGVDGPYCLHGLNAVYLQDIGWYRIDARGNREAINAEFTPPRECLAFPTELPGEYDLPEIYVAPLPVVTQALRRFTAWNDLGNHLPDVPTA